MDWPNTTAERDRVLMGAAMTPPTRPAHDQAVDPTAPKGTMRCEKQFGLLGAPLATCDREWGHSGSHSAAGAPFTGARDEGDERRTAAKAIGEPREVDDSHVRFRELREHIDSELRVAVAQVRTTRLTAEQEIRARALDYATRLVAVTFTNEDLNEIATSPTADDAIELAGRFADWIRGTPATVDQP